MRLMLIAGLAVLVFAAQNPQTITIQALFWKTSFPLVIIIVAVFAIGFFVGLTQLLPGYWKHRSSAKKSAKELKVMKNERDSLKQRSGALEEKIKQMSPSQDSSS